MQVRGRVFSIDSPNKFEINLRMMMKKQSKDKSAMNECSKFAASFEGKRKPEINVLQTVYRKDPKEG